MEASNLDHSGNVSSASVALQGITRPKIGNFTILKLLRRDFEVLDEDETLINATQKLWEKGQRYACVVNESQLIGVFDLLEAVDSLQKKKSWDPENGETPIGSLTKKNFPRYQIYSDPVVVSRYMMRSQMAYLPIFEGEHVVGVITAGDVGYLLN